MAILETYEKQPREVQDYDITFEEYLAALDDTGASHTAEAPEGITLLSSTLIDGVVKVWLSGGTSGQKYKITVILTTTGGRTREGEIIVKVKEV